MALDELKQTPNRMSVDVERLTVLDLKRESAPSDPTLPHVSGLCQIANLPDNAVPKNIYEFM